MEDRDIRILLVDDHDLVLHGLKHIIESGLPDVKKICTASSGHEAMTLISSQQFHLCILDLELPDMSGLELIASIRDRSPETRVIVNTMHEELWMVKNLIQAEVDGILFKSVDSVHITKAIRQVLDGVSYYCPYADHVRAQMKHSGEWKHGDLTQRELDVLKLISEGQSTQEIAQKLCLSTNTVDTHRRHLLEKMGARNVADLIMTAISRGIIPIRKH